MAADYGDDADAAVDANSADLAVHEDVQLFGAWAALFGLMVVVRQRRIADLMTWVVTKPSRLTGAVRWLAVD